MIVNEFSCISRNKACDAHRFGIEDIARHRGPPYRPTAMKTPGGDCTPLMVVTTSRSPSAKLGGTTTLI